MEAETAVDNPYVIVYGFGDACNRDVLLQPNYLLRKFVRPSVGSVAAYDEE